MIRIAVSPVRSAAAIFVMLAMAALGPLPARADPAFRAWVEALWPEAKAAGVRRGTFDAAFAGVLPDTSLPDLILPGQVKAEPRGQAEFVRPPQDYLDARLLANLATQGRQLAAQHAASTAGRYSPSGGARPRSAGIASRITRSARSPRRPTSAGARSCSATS